MKLVAHNYYNRSSNKREMASTKKSIKIKHKEISSRTTQDEDHQSWMNEILDEENFREDNEVVKGKIISSRRRIPTLNRGSMPDRRFNELILTIHNMIGSITTMQK